MSTVAIGTIAAGALAAGASAYGASKQAGAAKNAQELQANEAQNALQFQEQEFQTEQANEAPFIKAGQGAVGTLSNLIKTPGQGLLTPWTQTFQAPTAAQAEQYPGYQFQLGQGEQAIQNAASAQGELLDPNAARAEAGYAENLAQTDYGNVYNQAFNQYQQQYQQFLNNQNNEYNRLAGVAGLGQQATATAGQQGQQAATNTGNIMLTTGAEQGQDMQNAAAATASGYIGGANAIGGSLSNVGTMLALQQLLQAQNPNPGAGITVGPG